MNVAQLPGSLKVAVLIHSMDKATTDRILAAMSEQERKLVKEHLAQLGDTVSPEIVNRIAEEFLVMAGRLRKQREAKSLEAPEKEKSKDTDDSKKSGSLEALRSIEPDQLIEMIRNEHPQTIAIILVHVHTDTACRVLAKLPEGVKAEVAFRIANLDKVISGMVDEIDMLFNDLLHRTESQSHKVGGIHQLADILNQADGITGTLILNEIEEANPELAAEIKQMMFVFEDLILVDDRGMQKVLQRVDSQKLAMALKGASEEVRKKVFKNMSSRAGEMLQEEIDAIGAVRMRDVEEAQQTITRIIQELETRGEVVISGRGGGDVIS